MERHRRKEKEHLKLETLNKRKVRMELHRRTETGAFKIRDFEQKESKNGTSQEKRNRSI